MVAKECILYWYMFFFNYGKISLFRGNYPTELIKS